MAGIEVDVVHSIEAVNKNQWNEVIERSDLGNLFHRYEWLLAAEESFDSEPYHVIARKGDNPIGVFPNFKESISVDGFTDWTERIPIRRMVSADPGSGGPVILTDEQACLERMFTAISDVDCRDTLYHTVRTVDLGYTRYSSEFEKEGYDHRVRSCRFRLDLQTTWESILENMHKSRRQGLRRADRAGIEVIVQEPSDETMQETYKAYTAHMNRIGVEPFPEAFFRHLFRLLDDRIVVFVARCDGEEVGRYLHLLDDERSAIHYYFAGIPSTEASCVSPSEALHGAAIRWGQDHGYDYYDFGGTAADLNDGVFRYKRRFGAELIPMLAWQKGFSRVGWPLFKLARRLYQRRNL